MLQNTNGIVLRSVKYGDSSLVTTIFTAGYGTQTYMVKGVRSSKPAHNRASFFQPGMLLELVVYHQPNKNIQYIREFQAAHIYSSIQENVVKNAIALFSVELLLRLLPENAPLPELFDFVTDYFIVLDKKAADSIANFPLYFIIQCSAILGYELKGAYSMATPYLNLQEGGFTEDAPGMAPFVTDEEARAMGNLLRATDYDMLKHVEMNAAMRQRLIGWYVAFLQRHTQHMGNMRSLPVLQAILH